MNLNEVSLKRIKQNIVNSILNDMVASEELTDEEARIRKAELEQKIVNNELIFSGDLQYDITNATKFNKTSDELYIDVLTSFGYLNSLEKTVYDHTEQNQATINNLKAMINAINDRVDSYEAIIASKGNPQHYIEGFRTSNSFHADRSLYTERYGEPVPLSNTVSYNNEEELITLPYLRKENMIAYGNGVALGEASVSKQLCGRLIKVRNGENIIANVTDTSLHGYWSETILTDEPIRVSFDKDRPTDSHDLKDYYYGITNGALCEVEINFEAVSRINEISLLPYGQYPLDILTIRYRMSDDINEPVKEVVYPDNDNEHLRNRRVSAGTTYRFLEINCKRLYIIINQIHFTKSTFLLSSNELFKNELWFSATGQEQEQPAMKDDVIFKPMYNDRALMDSAWKYLNDLTVKDNNIDVKRILFNKDDLIKPVIKYEYNYGFHNVSPNYVEFATTGVYVSNPVQAGGNIKTVRVFTEEEHPLPSDTHVTDIEYYITTKDKPDWDDWHPILPTNKDMVESELLQLEYSTCKLRFPADQVITVKHNKTTMTKDYDFFLVHNSEGKVIAIDIPNFDFFAKYTVCYQPCESGRTVDLMPDDKPIISNSYEVIPGQDTSSYLLKEHPYTFSEVDPATDVRLVNKYTGETLSQAGGQIKCVTDPYAPSESYRKFDKTSTGYQYYTDGNNIYFNQNITKDYDIEINYSHFASSIKLKAIFRRNTLNNFWVSPTLKKIQYEFVIAD